MGREVRGRSVSGSGPRLARLCAVLSLVSLVALADPGGAAEEGGTDGGPDWIPSLGAGFGIYSRGYEARVSGDQVVNRLGLDANGQIIVVPFVQNGFFTTTRGSGVPTFRGYNCSRGSSAFPWLELPQPDGSVPAGVCGPFDGKSDDSLDGGAPSFNAQLLGPVWDGMPLRPRPLFQAGLAWPTDSRNIAEEGVKVSDFDTVAEPAVRLELDADPSLFWWIGAGAALELPIERYSTRLKFSLGYMEDEVELKGSVANDFGTGIQFNKSTQTLVVRSIAPAIGLEADLARFGPLMLTVSADTIFSVALSDTSAVMLVPAPPSNTGAPTGTATMTYEGEDLLIFGGVQFRFGWMGFER
jgi:hypothetical protein